MGRPLPSGRADTPEKKRAVMEAILAAWLKSPHQRLGQLLVNLCRDGSDLFYVEDTDLAGKDPR